ncbi:MAG: DUF4292 domain-containing protein [Saprospiraceae bacterium]|nr:DUF4292 domain-containing protein [Saprospiraceae bacterium]
MNKPLFWLGIAALLLFAACHSAKGLAANDLKKRSTRFLLKELVENQVDAEWFSAKAKITYSDAYENMVLSSNIRIRKDSLIWMNFKKLSVEAVRIQITPDSIYIIDRLNNQYSIKGFGFLQKQYQLPATFESLQNLLLGNPVFFTTDLESDVLGQQYQLVGAGTRYSNTYLLNGLSYLLEGLILEDKQEKLVLTAVLSDYRKTEGARNFSYFRSVTLQGEDKDEISVELELSKVEINVPKIISFEIPERYTRMD